MVAAPRPSSVPVLVADWVRAPDLQKVVAFVLLLRTDIVALVEKRMRLPGLLLKHE